MEGIVKGLYKFSSQVLYFVSVPVFLFFFILVYKPFDLYILLDMERDLFAFNVTMLTAILFVSLLLSRLVFYLFRSNLDLTYFRYSVWCILEIITSSLFVALYVWLMYGTEIPYFDVMIETIQDMFLALIFPYVIITMYIVNRDKRWKEHNAEPTFDPKTHTRFCDANNNQKLIVATSTILYIAAEENYVRIYYVDDDRISTYLLRNAMKNLDETCALGGIVRCHRSYFVNPARVKLLKKERDGVVYAELEAPVLTKIPVSKKYYDALNTIL